MKRLFSFATVSMAALSFTFISAAQAAVITGSLDQISASNIGSGSLGTVTLTQNGSFEVDVSVVLAANTEFVNSGGPHTPFTFELDLTGAAITVTSPSGGVFYAQNLGGADTPYGAFNYAIGYTGKNGGPPNGNPGPLDFEVTDALGISVYDFVPNAAQNGYYFAADVYGPGGNTGSVAANEVADPPTPAVPEPASFTILASALLGLAVARKRMARTGG